MRTCAPKLNAPQQHAAPGQGLPGRTRLGERREVLSSSASYPGFDFSRTPVDVNSPPGLPGAAGIRERQQLHVLHRRATGSGPAWAPPIVHDVLRHQGWPLPAELRRDAQAALGHDFADVRVHTDETAGASAVAVAADAYTVGRQIVFAPGRFEPRSPQGRRLLLHELTHAASHPPGAPTPSGDLQISLPGDATERQAVAVSNGAAAPGASRGAAPGLFRQAAGLVALRGVSVNHDRVTVPPAAGLSFSARQSPANAPGITLTVVGDNATIAAGTSVDNATGVITVASGQTGGSAHVEASQNATGPGGATLQTTTPATAPFNFTAIPSGITSTSVSAGAGTGSYGGEFTHTFTSPAGGQAALERSHVNERFAAARGSSLTVTGPLGTVTIAINSPNSPAAGWDLDSSGTMTGPDHVTWSNAMDARPFVANASHPSPSPGLPQELTAIQEFRNLEFPSRTYGAGPVASTTHRRAIEERNDRLKAVTSANAAGINQEVVEDYAGPSVFRRCRADPASIPVAVSASPRGAAAPAATTSTITVDVEGHAARPTFSIRPPNLGCRITAGGVLTPGTTAGTVTVRAGSSTNYDETTVTLTPTAATPTPNPGP